MMKSRPSESNESTKLPRSVEEYLNSKMSRAEWLIRNRLERNEEDISELKPEQQEVLRNKIKENITASIDHLHQERAIIEKELLEKFSQHHDPEDAEKVTAAKEYIHKAFIKIEDQSIFPASDAAAAMVWAAVAQNTSHSDNESKDSVEKKPGLGA